MSWTRSGQNRVPTLHRPNKVAQDKELQAWLLYIQKTVSSAAVNYTLATQPGDNRPHLEVKLFGTTLTGLLDSGATRSILGSAGWRAMMQLGVTLTREHRVSCTVADGTRFESAGNVDIPVMLENKLRIINFLVFPTFPTPLILGIDFWKHMNIVPNMQTGKWVFAHTVGGDKVQTRLHTADEVIPADNEKLVRLKDKYFRLMGTKLGCTHLVQHRITTTAEPIKQRYYPLSPKMQEQVNQELDKMLADKVIERSSSPWSSPILLVRKPDQSYRFVVDYRKVNSVTQRDAYPLPYVNTILDKLRNAKYLSSLDLKSAYWQIPMEESSKPITAFTVPGRGLFQFNRMPFGLHNSPATWQRFMDRLLGEEFEPYAFVYLDDIIIITPNFELHLTVLEQIFQKIVAAGLTLNPEKCKFCVSELKYLGYVVNRNGLQVDPGKITAILNIPVPTTMSQVRRFIGVASWYRRFINNFSTLTAPLTALLKKNRKWIWTEECQQSFNAIKEKLVSAPILNCPNFEYPFIVQTDASGYGIGAVLTQKIDDDERVIAYASRTLNKQERNYSTTERECLAVIWGVEKFRSYLEGTRFTVVTDHHSLIWLNRLKDPVGRLARWAVRMQQFDFQIIHRRANELVVPDLLSRSVSEDVQLITIDQPIVDPWYRQMMERINENPAAFRNWKIEDKVLYRFIHSTAQAEPAWKMVVPKEYRREVLREGHDAPTAGHAGIYKTVYRASQLYYWPGMRSDIANYVRKCKVCQQNKPDLRGASGLMGKRPDICQPWQLISLDLMDFPRSKKGNKHLLVIADYFSKFINLTPLRTATASKVTEILEKEIFLVYGVPQYIICDNGPQFIAHDFKGLARKYNVRLMYNAHYHPQNNPTERVNQVVKRMIKSYLGDNHQEWDQWIPHIQCAINTNSHEVTGLTPYFVNYGREHILSGRQFGNALDNTIPPLRLPPREEQPFRELFETIRNKMKQAHHKNEKYYNLRRRPVRYEIGQRVWRRNYCLSDASKHFAAKLAPKYVGPFLVKKKLSPVTYMLTNLNGLHPSVWHVQDIKPVVE